MFGVLSSVLEAAAEYTKYKYKNKKPVEFEEWQARQREIDDSIAKGDTQRISGFLSACAASPPVVIRSDRMIEPLPGGYYKVSPAWMQERMEEVSNLTRQIEECRK